MDQNSGCIDSLDVASFYGGKNKTVSCGSKLSNVERRREICESNPSKNLPFRLNNLLGPSQLWKVFKKQQDALECAKKLCSGLMTFAFQQSDGNRLFLVAHPKLFWYYDSQKSSNQRCAYEIIPESTVCKLYFDIEFDTAYNKDKNGPSIVDTFIAVVLFFLSSLFDIQIDMTSVLKLDSSTCKKFSCHLIFQLGLNAFRDNKSVGEFVTFICRKLELYLSPYDLEENDNILKNKLKTSEFNLCRCCRISDPTLFMCIRKTGLSIRSLKNLLVFDKKGNKRLVCDLSVYSKNRHFRLYQNTKWGRNSPLITSKDNCYSPIPAAQIWKENSSSSEIYEETLFLDSLITHFRCAKDVSDLKVLNIKPKLNLLMGQRLAENDVVLSSQSNDHLKFNDHISANQSPYPCIDKFINLIIFPGKIWKTTYFETSSLVVYNIVGNRFCNNIKRYHQSNNVKYIVDLKKYIYYQKCHDPDCSMFRSEPRQLPPELLFELEDDLDIKDINFALKEVESSDLSDTELLEAVDVIEDMSAILSDSEVY